MSRGERSDVSGFTPKANLIGKIAYAQTCVPSPLASIPQLLIVLMVSEARMPPPAFSNTSHEVIPESPPKFQPTPPAPLPWIFESLSSAP